MAVLLLLVLLMLLSGWYVEYGLFVICNESDPLVRNPCNQLFSQHLSVLKRNNQPTINISPNPHSNPQPSSKIRVTKRYDGLFHLGNGTKRQYSGTKRNEDDWVENLFTTTAVVRAR